MFRPKYKVVKGLSDRYLFENHYFKQTRQRNTPVGHSLTDDRLLTDDWSLVDADESLVE